MPSLEVSLMNPSDDTDNFDDIDIFYEATKEIHPGVLFKQFFEVKICGDMPTKRF